MGKAFEHQVLGFSFAATSAGIKRKDHNDLALICADEPVPAAAVFTKNLVKAAPVLLSQQRLSHGDVRGVLVNSGNANACTGQQGERAALQCTAQLAEHLQCAEQQLLMASTGVIGQQLPVSNIVEALPKLTEALTPEGADDFAKAIMTTDRWPKIAMTEVELGDERVRILGIAKGAGMIHPNMATTLCFVMTDAAADATLLRQSLRRACDESFNIATVDGDTSTNDMILLMASGKAMKCKMTSGSKATREFTAALKDVLYDLAKSIVRDGEGAEHAVTIQVSGLADAQSCKHVARTIATSLLVKTAMHGCDPNWGRLMMAAGNAGVKFDPHKVQIKIGPVVIVDKGLGLGAQSEAQAAEHMKQEIYTIALDFGASRFSAKYLTSDISNCCSAHCKCSANCAVH